MSPAAGRVDLVVVGGGIVGLATARALLRDRPGLDLVLLEREDTIAAHQSGHNSGVIHSGLYYKPGSQKALLCTTGRLEMEDYATAAGIPWERCGKVVVASAPDEVPALAKLAERGRANGLEIEELSAAGLTEHEPHAVGLASLFVPATGVVDYKLVCQRLADEVTERGGRILTGVGVESAIDTGGGVVIRSDAGLWWADRVVTCAGAWSDLVAEAGGEKPSARILPFRGEYLELRPDAAYLVNHLIYPVPDPRFPFLGVHFTRGIDGTVHAGPNAVPAFGRDAYTWKRFRAKDAARFAARPSTWRLAAKHWRTGTDEIVRSLMPSRMLSALQRLVPEVTADDLVPAGSGVRAQAINPDGTLLDDFEIVRRGRCVHVVNAPSPAATASLAIGAWIAREVEAADGSPDEPAELTPADDENRDMSSGGSNRAILAALLANLGIAIAKFIKFLFTSSSSMLAESVHSVADTGNQVLLLIGGKRSRREATRQHPFGFGRERFFWAFVVSIVLFTLGSGFALYEGIEKLLHPHELESAGWAIAILLVAIVLESWSFRTAVHEARPLKGSASWIHFIRRSKQPELPVVLLEDSGALIGLVIALSAVGMSIITGNGIWDGVGTTCIGVLLGAIAIVLAIEMKSLLIGEAASEQDEAAIIAAIVGADSVRELIDVRTEHIGPETILVAAKVQFDDQLTMRELADVVDALEARVRAAVPAAARIFVEPDVVRPMTATYVEPVVDPHDDAPTTH